jgi:hypothetical protein
VAAIFCGEDEPDTNCPVIPNGSATSTGVQIPAEIEFDDPARVIELPIEAVVLAFLTWNVVADVPVVAAQILAPARIVAAGEPSAGQY